VGLRWQTARAPGKSLGECGAVSSFAGKGPDPISSQRTCVIFNPTAARGRARRRLHDLQHTLGADVILQPTQRPGHAEELAQQAVAAGFDVVAAAGGDGTVHEVASGVLRAGRREVVFGVLPLGSANDYVYSLAAADNSGPAVHQVDAGIVCGEGGREGYFVNTLGLGFSGAVALESRRIHWLQGLALYGLAFFRALCFHYQRPIMTVDVDQESRQVPTLSLTVALGQREGSFVVAPQAVLDDGWFDYLHVGALPRREVLRYLPRLASGGQLPADHPRLWQGRCRQLRLRSEKPLTVHLDGEFFSRPEDGVRSLEVRILPRALRVQQLNLV
jgi:diacylglycerol kinase family enzyme